MQIIVQVVILLNFESNLTLLVFVDLEQFKLIHNANCATQPVIIAQELPPMIVWIVRLKEFYQEQVVFVKMELSILVMVFAK